MKKTGKIILTTFLIFISLIIILLVVAALAENKIAKIAVDQVSKTTSIPIEVERIDFSLLHDFPYATLRCKNLLVNSPFESSNNTLDTLAFLEQLYISVDVKPLLKSIFNVRKVEIGNGSLYYKVDSLGFSNLDFLNDTTQLNGIDTSGNNIHLNIKDFTAKEINCYYNDENQKASANLFIENLNLSGVINHDHYNGKAEGNVILSNCSYDTTNLYLMNRTTLGFHITYDEGILTVNRANITVDEDAQMALNGSLNISENISVQLSVNADKLDVGGLLKYVPELSLNEYGIKNVSGILSAKATISGLITDSIQPAITAELNFVEGNLQYQDYPVLSNISMQAKLTNDTQQNSKTSAIDIHLLSFQTPKSKFSVSGNVTDLDMPYYALQTRFEVDLDEVRAFIPDSLVQLIDGKIKASISTNGVLPDSISDAFIQSVMARTRAHLELFNVNAIVDSSLSVNNLNAQFDYQPNHLDIKNLSAEIPSYDLNLKKLNAAIDGNMMKTDSLHYMISDLNAYVPGYDLSVNELNAEAVGDYSNPETLDVKLKRFVASSGNSNIELAGKIKNPMKPKYAVSGKVNLDLAELKKFVPDSLVNSMSGYISASFQSEATLNLDSISEKLYDLVFVKSNFDLDFEEVNISMPDSMMNVGNVSGQLSYKYDSLYIQQLTANYLGMQLGMNSVSVANVYSAAVQNQPKELVVKGNFSVGDLDYAVIENLMLEDTTANTEISSEPMNFTYKINGRFTAKSLKYEDALFKNVSSKFLVKENYYVLDSMNLNAFDGRALSSIKVEILPDDEMNLFFKTNISKMDVTKLMQSFKDYVEIEDIKAENVQGILSTKMDGKIVLKNYEPVYESLMLNGDLTIDNGALINVKPVMEVETITGIGLKNMDRLYFSMLNSSIFLFQNELYIPQTEIRSTSFDAMFLGMYSFGVDYEYHIRMFLGEVLSSKSKANLKKQAEDGGFTDEDEKDVTKGRTSIYVVSKSENGKEKAGFDNKRDRLNMVAKVKLQKQMVDMRFNPALINYSTKE